MASHELKEKLSATICIPTYNGEKRLKAVLESVYSQQYYGDFDVIVIDSGSNDNTLNILSKFPKILLRQIPNTEFGHGRTRNLAASLAGGDIMVYLTQDAVPASKHWLEYMIEPFILNEDIVCVFGKQIPYSDCDPTTKREVSSVFNSLGPDHSIMINREFSLLTDKKVPTHLTFFSDVNSAVKRKFLLDEVPYRDVIYSEDQLFGRDILSRKFLKAYSPLASVMHSNEYGLRDYFYRKHDEYMGMFESLGVVPEPGRIKFIKRSIKGYLKDISFIIRDKDYSAVKKIFYAFDAFIRNFEREYAAYLVSNDNHRKENHAKYSLEKRLKENTK